MIEMPPRGFDHTWKSVVSPFIRMSLFEVNVSVDGISTLLLVLRSKPSSISLPWFFTLSARASMAPGDACATLRWALLVAPGDRPLVGLDRQPVPAVVKQQIQDARFAAARVYHCLSSGWTTMTRTRRGRPNPRRNANGKRVRRQRRRVEKTTAVTHRGPQARCVMATAGLMEAAQVVQLLGPTAGGPPAMKHHILSAISKR